MLLRESEKAYSEPAKGFHGRVHGFRLPRNAAVEAVTQTFTALDLQKVINQAYWPNTLV